MMQQTLSWLLSHIILAAEIIGLILMVASAFLLAAFLLSVAAGFTGKYAWKFWRELETVYRLHTMQYWFRRMQANGTHVMSKAAAEALEAKKAREAVQ